MKKLLAFSLLLACSFNGTKSFAQEKEVYSYDKTIDLPGSGAYDYLYIDQENKKLYISHGSAVNVIDLSTEKLIATIGDMKKVHGIAIANKEGKGFISDGNANAVVVFDIKTNEKITTIPISGKKPDAIIYDAFSNQVFAFNGGSNNASVIDANTLKEVGTAELGGGPEFAVSDGKGKIYNNLEDKSSLNVIDSKAMKVIANYPLSPCGGPTGIAFDAVNQRTFSVCRENKGMTVVNVITGKVVATIPIGSGVDAVAYDAATKLIFVSNGDATTTIIKQESADKYSIVQTLKTQTKAKTLALDKDTHKIYLSYNDGSNFKVLVYKMN